MKRTLTLLAVAGAVAAGAAVGIPHPGKAADDYNYGPRQYYSDWHEYKKKDYHYRTYYYKPEPQYYGYKYNYVIYKPEKPDYCYYYSPDSRKYWGRCPVDTGGKPAYSMLAERDRKGRLEDIPESAFPQPGPLPPVPGSRDGAVLDLPPSDLPAEAKLPR